MTDTVRFYLSRTKTPLPSAEHLCSAELGASYNTQFIPNRCTCEIQLGFYTFALGKKIALARAEFLRSRGSPLDPKESEKLFQEISKRVTAKFMDELQFKECCRNKIWSCQNELIVSSDIGALFVSEILHNSMLLRTKDAPGVTIARPAPPLPTL